MAKQSAITLSAVKLSYQQPLVDRLYMAQFQQHFYGGPPRVTTFKDS